MKIVIQRVKRASCSINQNIVSEIQQGLLLLVGIEDVDTEQDVVYAVRKIANMRIFSDEQGKMNLSVKDIPDGSILSISQFTLFAETKKGNRPSFIKAGKPEYAKALYEKFKSEVDFIADCYVFIICLMKFLNLFKELSVFSYAY